MSVSSAYAVKVQEKEDLKGLNNKLASYVDKVRQLGGSGKDAAAFLASLALVEDELRKLKALYETEIEDLRQKLNSANRAKNNSQMEAEKLKRAVTDLDDKYKAESSKNDGLLSDIKGLKEKIADLEQQLAVTRATMQGPTTQLADTKRELAKTLAQNQAMNDELSQEKSKGKQLQDTVDDLQKKLSFNDQVKKEQLTEAENRNGRSKGVIEGLNETIKDLEAQIATAPEMMAKLRANADTEIKKFKDESEAAFKKSVADMKGQMDAQAANLEKLRAANRDLQAQNDDLRNNMIVQEASIRELKTQIAAYEDQVKAERGRSAEQIRDLEKKLQELQDKLFTRMGDLNANRELQVSLRAEIETMRALLEAEEKRLGGLPATSGSRSDSALSPTHSRVASSGGNGGNTNLAGNNAGTGAGAGKTGQTGKDGADNTAKYATPPFLMKSEYQYSYNKTGYGAARNYMSYMKSGQTPGSRPSSTSADGFPTLDTTCNGGFTTGSSKMYMTRSPDVRGNGTYANANNGQISQARLPPVY